MQGAALLAIGALISLLLSALVLVLTRSREHALGMVAGEDRRAAPPGAARRAHRAAQPRPRARPRRADARPRAAPARPRRPRSTSTSTASSRSTTASATRPATSCCGVVAGRLADVVRDGDTAARLGGDEFVVLRRGLDLDAGPELVAERILEVLRQPYRAGRRGGRPLTMTASIGIAIGERGSADELLARRRRRPVRGEGRQRDRYVLFESEMQTAAQDRLTLQMDLADALERRPAVPALPADLRPPLRADDRRRGAACAGATPRAASSPRTSSSRSPRRAG